MATTFDIDETPASHEPLLVSGRRSSAVLVSQESWAAVQETLFLLCVPGMRESIREGLATEIEDCDEVLDWRLGTRSHGSSARC